MPTKVGTYRRASEASMTAPQEYRRHARHLLQMAKRCEDTQIAARLRIIAADYLDCSVQGGEQDEDARSTRPRRKAS